MELAFVGRLLAACIVIGLVLGAVQFVAGRLGRVRLERGTGGKLVSLVETTMLPGAASLHVVRVADRYYVIGRNAAAISTLCEIPFESVDRFLETRRESDADAVAPMLRFAERFGKRT